MSRYCSKTVLGLLALLLAGSARGASPAVTVDWQRPDVDFSRYSAFVIKPLDLDDVKVLKPAWEQDGSEPWTFDPATAEAVQEVYMRIMTETLSGDGGYAIVHDEGKDVLQLEVEFLSVTPYVRPGVTSATSESAISTLGSGDVVVSAELRDSVTGSLLRLVEGERQLGTEYRELSRESHIANLEATFRLWGRTLRDWLDREHGSR